MKSLIRWIVIVGALSGGAAHAQDISGTWQGTLNAGKELRIVVTIASAAGGGLTAMMYSIDQGQQGISANPVTLQGTTFRMAVSAIGGTFEGQLSAKGNSIAGSWSQGGGSFPLTLTRATPETAWAIPAPPKQMAPDAPAAFEVATIKPSNPDVPGKVFTVRGRQVMTINTTVSDLISFAYRVHAAQVAGAPEWVASIKYDVTGQPGTGTAQRASVAGNGPEAAGRAVQIDHPSRHEGTGGLRDDRGEKVDQNSRGTTPIRTVCRACFSRDLVCCRR